VGLWIAPDLERRTKGEHGRRGLVDAPYGYYLQLADVALEQTPGALPRHVAEQHPETLPIFTPAMAVTPPDDLPPFPAAPPTSRPAAARGTSRPAKLSMPKPALRNVQRPMMGKPVIGKLGKFQRPKPPSRNVPKFNAPKLNIPKPPRRDG